MTRVTTKVSTKEASASSRGSLPGSMMFRCHQSPMYTLYPRLHPDLRDLRASPARGQPARTREHSATQRRASPRRETPDAVRDVHDARDSLPDGLRFAFGTLTVLPVTRDPLGP